MELWWCGGVVVFFTTDGAAPNGALITSVFNGLFINDTYIFCLSVVKSIVSF